MYLSIIDSPSILSILICCVLKKTFLHSCRLLTKKRFGNRKKDFESWRRPRNNTITMANYNESSGLVPETGDTFVERHSDDGVLTRNIHNARFLGCCCDFRRTILLINGVFIGKVVLGMVYIGAYGINVCLNPDGCFNPDPKGDRFFLKSLWGLGSALVRSVCMAPSG